MAIPKTKGSGGPRTAQGKAAVSQNAIKTGAYAVRHLLPGEDPAQFDELLQQFQQDFAPQDIAEAAMVRDLAVMTWKQLRIEGFQHAMLLAEFREPVSQSDLKFKGNFSCPDAYFDFADMALDAGFDEMVSEQEALEILFEKCEHPPSKSFLDIYKKKFPDRFDEMIEEFRSDTDADGISQSAVESLLLTYTVTGELGEEDQSYVRYHFELSNKYRQGLYWVKHNKEELIQAYRAVKAHRAVSMMQHTGAARAMDELQRAFYRTLGELSKQQTWRRNQRMLDVTPASQIDV